MHLPDVENCVADTLSRLLQFIRPHPQLHPQPRHHQHRFKSHYPWPQSWFLQHYLRMISSPLRILISPSCLHYSHPPLQVLPIPYRDFTVLWDVSSGFIHPLVPTSLRKQIFFALHRIPHSGVQASMRLISSCFVWPGILAYGLEVAFLINKTRFRPTSSSKHSGLPGRGFAHVHIDLVDIFLQPPARRTY